MYMPIAVLYNERGAISAVRFLNWGAAEGEFRTIQEDTVVSAPIFIRFTNCMRSRVLDIPITVVRSLESGTIQFNVKDSRSFSIYNFSSITKILSDGRILDDTVLLLGYRMEESVLIVDYRGRISEYNSNKLYEDCEKAGVSLGNTIADTEIWYDVVCSLKYADSLFITDYNNLLFQSELSKIFDLFYDENMGRVACYIRDNAPKSVLVPDLVDYVGVVAVQSCIEMLVLPETCDISVPNSGVLRGLKGIRHSSWFVIHGESNFEELELPTSMTLDCSESANFELYVGELPESFTEIDQSNYDLTTNHISITGRHSLEQIKLQAITRGFTYINMSCVAGLRAIKLMGSETDRHNFCMNFGQLQGELDVHCYAGLDTLQLYFNNPTYGVLRIYEEACVGALSFILDFPVRGCWEGKLVVVVEHYGEGSFVWSCDGQDGITSVSVRNKFNQKVILHKLKADMDESRLIKDFRQSTNQQKSILVILKQKELKA